MRTSIQHDLVKKSEAKEDFVKEEGGDSFGSDRFLGRAKNHPLSKFMVYHDQERIEARGDRKIHDKITGNLLERVRGKGFDRRQGGIVGYVLTLFCWQMAQPSMYQWMKEASPSHQNSAATNWRVFRKPGWPADSWSWQHSRMAWWRESSAGT